MKSIRAIISLLLIASILSAFVSCGNGECNHAYHNDAEWTITKAPDCFNEGEAYNTCFKCGEKVTLTVMKLEHSYATPVIEQPTCTTEGKMTQDCTLCGMLIISDRKPALGHELNDNCECTVCGETVHEFGENNKCKTCGAAKE